MLLRTSVLDRVNGELADLLTGNDGGERVLQDLEQANAFVVSVDAARSWFRYHQMFAGLLRLKLRRTAPGEVAGLHRTASSWFAAHGHPVEAIRHAQSAGDWDLTARLLADYWPGLYLDGPGTLVHELLAGFPAEVRAANAQFAALIAFDKLAQGSLKAAEWYLGTAEHGMASVPQARRAQSQLLLGIARLHVAHQRGDLSVVAQEAQQLEAATETDSVAQSGLDLDLRALVLIELGAAGVWPGRFREAASHLEHGVALARRIGRPFLEFGGVAHLAMALTFKALMATIDYGGQANETTERDGWSTEPAAGTARLIHGAASIQQRPQEGGSWSQQAAEYSTRAIELAERHGWCEQPTAGTAYLICGFLLIRQGRLEEGEYWVQQAERTVRAEATPRPGWLSNTCAVRSN